MESHNGDVLVDSLNLTQVKGSSEDNNSDKTDEIQKPDEIDSSETSLVTSDDASVIQNTDEYFREARETLTYVKFSAHFLFLP